MKKKKAKKAKAKVKKVKEIEVPQPAIPGLVPGALVSYYDEGWRYGYVDELVKSLVFIKPIGPKGSNPRVVSSGVEDVRVCPTKAIVPH